MTRKINTKKKSRIPTFKSYEEEANWWDTHSAADYWNELKPVKVHFAKNLSHGITVRLEPKTIDTLRQKAHAKGIGPTTLARMWILERLEQVQ